jgi:hypothetical protein
MTKLHEQIEDMRARLTEIAEGDSALVKALGEALARVDEKLLADVRHVAAAHEARRGAIMYELQALASRLCVFPASAERVAAVENHEEEAYLPSYVPVNGNQEVQTRGDWRQAASNIQDELEFHLNGHPPSH